MLELENICFEREGKKILDNINLKVDLNQFIAITGPNGGGKSTLAKLIIGIEKPDSGRIYFNGENITDFDIAKRANKGISFAFQQPVKFKGITVKDLISLSLRKNVKFSDACKYLSDVGLCPRDYMEREINSSLSGGELKRIEIATVVARNSKLTIFDEPEAGIDLWSFNNLISVFENMYNTINGSIIIISHQERILKIADKIILIANGKIEKIGKKEEILPSEILESKKICNKLKEKNLNGKKEIYNK